MNIKDILGGADQIRNNANAWTLRASEAPLINKETQPIIYSILEIIARKEGLTAEEYQQKMDKELL